MNPSFFEELYADSAFAAQLGKVTLASGRFESNLRAYLALHGVDVREREASLGSLIARLEQHECISQTGVQVLRDLKEQRNYLTHSLFDLFAARVPESRLPRTDLLPSDTSMFADAAWQLEQNLNGLNEIVERKIQQLLPLDDDQRQSAGLLFAP